jgi:hypothetical protein
MSVCDDAVVEVGELDPGEPAPTEPALAEPIAPDPVALSPAGLDPHTLCKLGASCEPPVNAAITLAAAQLGYVLHPTRIGGDERSARLDVWRELAWSVHVAYTADRYDDVSAAGISTTVVHDLALGGRIALPLAIPAWATATVHVLSGGTTGNGDAIYGALGARLAGFDVELGASAMELDGDTSTAANLRVTRGDSLRGWLEVTASATQIRGMPGAEVAGGGGLAWRHPRWALELSAQLGDRALAVTDGGELVEAVPDTFHTSGRALLRVAFGAHLAAYAGGTARTATTPAGDDYTQLVGFGGLSANF